MIQPSKFINKGLTAGLAAVGIALGAVGLAMPAQAQNKPNIVVIWGDDIGQSNLSTYMRSWIALFIEGKVVDEKRVSV